MPWMWIVAGPNGSGKSTFAENTAAARLPGRPSTKLNADDLSRSLRRSNPPLSIAEANLRAVRTIDETATALVERRETFLVETVLSTEKYKAVVMRAKELKYSVGLVFVSLSSPELNVERVALRVQRGGHGVPRDKILDRYEKSHRNLTWFTEHADVVLIYDNTGAGDRGAELIAEKPQGGSLRLLKPGVNPRVERELRPLLRS